MNSDYNVMFYDQYDNLVQTLETVTNAQVVGAYLVCGDGEGNSCRFFANTVTLIEGPDFSKTYIPIESGFFQQDQIYFNRLSEMYTYINTNVVNVVIRSIDALEFSDGTVQTTAGGGGGGSGTVTSISFVEGTGIDITGTNPITTSGTVTITNSAPDLTVTLTEGAGIDITGSYPNFTIASTGGGGIPHGIATGTDTYTTTIAGVTAYNDADAYLIRFTTGNTSTCTLQINTLPAVPLYRNNDGQLIGGDIIDGAEMLCVYNSSTNRFQVIGTAPNTLLAYVTNADSVAITKGQPVYAFGGQGDRLTVKRASNDSDATSAQTVGLVVSTSIGVNQKGLIMVNGLLDGLSIFPTSTWADGDPVYLGPTPGSITKIKPQAPNHLVYLGFVTRANNGSAGSIYIRVQNGYELDEIHDVQITSPVNGNMLVYDEATDLWKNSNVIQRTSTDAALRITQLGTGEAIRVEDETNPDSTPFVVAADGRVGIGINAPLSTYKLHVRNGIATNSSAAAGTIAVFENSSNSYCAVLSPDANAAGFAFGSNTNRTGALLNWAYSTNRLALTTNNTGAYIWFGTDQQAERMRITSTGSVGIGTTSPNASSLLDISSTTKGVLVPRMTTAERNAISSPATGLLVYDNTLNAFYFYNGSAWATMGGGGSGTVTSIATTSPILGGTITTSGTISIQQADASKDGYISVTDWNKFNDKQEALVSGSNIKTVNSETLLGSGNVAIPAGMNWMGSFPG
jgi:hypothetical protein